MANISISEAYLLGIWVESVLYGINVVLVCSCLFVLTRGKRVQDIEKTFVGVVAFQFLLSTASVALGLRVIIVAFIKRPPDEIDAYIRDISNPLRVAKTTFSTMNSIVNDIVLVWRVYCVWWRNWRVVTFPIVLVFATAACGAGQLIEFVRAGELHNLYLKSLKQWTESLYVASILTNVLGTGLIAFRILTMLHIGFLGPAVYKRLLTLIIESGMIYSFVLTLGAILYLIGNNSFYIVYETFAQVSSIIPTMILLLVGLKRTTTDQYRVSTEEASTEFVQHRRQTMITATMDSDGPIAFTDRPQNVIESEFMTLPYHNKDDT